MSALEPDLGTGRDADVAAAARMRRLLWIVAAWGVVTIALLWLFERSFAP